MGKSMMFSLISMPLVDCTANFNCKYCPKNCVNNPFPKDSRCPDCGGADKSNTAVCPVVDCVKDPTNNQCCLQTINSCGKASSDIQNNIKCCANP